MIVSAAERLTRRAFVARVAMYGGGLALSAGGLGTGRLIAQEVATPPGAPSSRDSSNLFAMDQSASRPVRLPPKPGVPPKMTATDRDALEHQIRCQCGCTLDVYTCRTTDFACQVSPDMHRDIMELVQGGYTAQEIIDQFVKVYGERALMAPTKEGFNLFGWAAPFVALAGGALAVSVVLRGWQRTAHARAAVSPGAAPVAVRPAGATDDERARLDSAVRSDDA
jgi:cytochrome c-type biogenesis protein CcmH